MKCKFLSKIDEYILRKICGKYIYQDFCHNERTEEILAVIQSEVKKVFYEDNLPTIESFLRDRIEGIFKYPRKEI